MKLYNSKATRVIGIPRVSDAKRQDSNDAQKARLIEFMEDQGFKNYEIIPIEESSTKADRKKFQEIINDIKRSKDVVALVVDTVDRLQRTFRESVMLDEMRREGKIEIYFYRENLVVHKDSNSADIIRWDMAVLFAKSYVLQLADNVKRKFDQMRKDGLKTGAVHLGYKAVYEFKSNGDRKRIDIVKDPEVAPLIIQAFTLFATGQYSIKTITKEMQKRGLKGKEGRPIGNSMMHFVLASEFYCGWMRTKDGIMPHRYERLISEDLFKKVQKILKNRRKNPTKFLAKDYIFRGLVRCANCGCLYSPEIKRGHLVYYSCTNAKGICTRVYMKEETFLEPVYEVLNKLQLPQARVNELLASLKTSSEAKNAYQHNERKLLNSEYEKLQLLINGAGAKFALDQITKSVHDHIVETSKERQREIEAILSGHTDADEAFHTTAAQVVDVARRALEIFKNSEVSEKRLFLSFLLQNTRADGKTLMFTMRKPFDTLIDLGEHPIKLRG